MSIRLEPPRFDRLAGSIERSPKWREAGRVADVVGLVVESLGPNARIGDLCWIEARGRGQSGAPTNLPSSCSVQPGSDLLPAEVVGFRGERTLLMPLGELEGIRAGSVVHATSSCLRVPVGEHLLGRCLDGLGRPIDDLGPLPESATYPVLSIPPSPLERPMIHDPLPTGVRAIDGLLTLGEGQRMGIFSGSGVGKSTLLGMIARNCHADVNVIALVGERGREVKEFIENDLGPEGLARSIIVCATSEQPALVRIKAALTATAIAEAFRDSGKRVLLMMDSVTRYAMALREVGLATGEPPSTKGYTPSVFAALPRLMERAGTSPKGSITALYTVLVEGDDTNEPIADAARSILDGHIVLSRKLTSRGHYPPIDVLQSLSRTMPLVTSPEHLQLSREVRELLAAYRDIEDLVSIGAYKTGARPLSDRALNRHEPLQGFLKQQKEEGSGFDQTLAGLQVAVG